jgi:hypothetical protein
MREDPEAVGLKVQEFTATDADVVGRLWVKAKRFGLAGLELDDAKVRQAVLVERVLADDVFDCP